MTSIEKVFELLEKKGDMRETPSIRNLQLNIDTSDYLELKRQAKEMHKQEIIDAWNGGDYAYFYSKETGRDFADGNDYYQETFGSKGSDEVELPQHPPVFSENGNELLFDKEGNLIKEVVEDDVEKLAEAEYPIYDGDLLGIANNQKHSRIDFIKGYNKAKKD